MSQTVHAMFGIKGGAGSIHANFSMFALHVRVLTRSLSALVFRHRLIVFQRSPGEDPLHLRVLQGERKASD